MKWIKYRDEKPKENKIYYCIAKSNSPYEYDNYNSNWHQMLVKIVDGKPINNTLEIESWLDENKTECNNTPSAKSNIQEQLKQIVVIHEFTNGILMISRDNRMELWKYTDKISNNGGIELCYQGKKIEYILDMDTWTLDSHINYDIASLTFHAER